MLKGSIHSNIRSWFKNLENVTRANRRQGYKYIYTHGEMLPSHGYPELNKYAHLVGNFGGAWQNQQRRH